MSRSIPLAEVRSSERTGWDRAIGWGGTLAAVLGVLALVGWLTHVSALVQILSTWPPLKWNSALCLVASGVAVGLLPGGRYRPAIWVGAGVFLVAALNLLEYMVPGAPHIDEIFMRDYLTAADALPGRMSALSATCFGLFGVGLLFAGLERLPAWRLAVTGLIGCCVAVITCLALLGYLGGIRAAYSWGAYTRMALPTAIALCSLSVSLLVWAWQTAHRVQFNLARWLPITAAVTLMVMVACVSAASLAQLKQSIYWRKHTYEVLISSQSLFSDLIDSQRGMRGYVLTGQQAALQTYRHGIEELPQKLAGLAALTRDNPTQQRRVALLSADLDAVISYSKRLLAARDSHGLQAAVDLEFAGEGRTIVDRTQADLDAFTGEEHRLLIEREARAQEDFRNTTDLLIVGSALAAVLLVLAHLMASREVNRRKRQEAELGLSEELFRRAFDDAPIGMCLVSPEGRLLKVNHAVCTMLGYPESELLQTDFQSITHPEDLELDLKLVRQVLSGELSSYQIEKRYLHRDGSPVHASLSVSVVRDRDDVPLYFVSHIENIAHRREMDRLKHEFISTVSHELRTPLTSIRGSLGLVDAGVLGELPEKARAMVKIAHQNSERLVRIINDILDVEKIESGKLELQIDTVTVAQLLREALEFNAPYGEKYRVHFVLERASEALRVRADPDRLMQVMANLLSNAAKFSASGAQVSIRAVRNGERVRIEVQDSGTGIPEEFRGRIFEKFAQADSSSGRRFDGTGLGLNITRRLVEAMHGTIGFTTVTGQGTTFHFDLPAAESAAEPSGGLASETARHRVLIYGRELPPASQQNNIPRILHVEDDLDLSQVIQTALEGRADIVSAATLQSAESYLRDESFSLIVLDLALPDGSGLSLLDRLEQLATRAPPVVILSVSEVPRSVQQRVAATLVKSRISESEVARTIMALVPGVA